MHREYIVKSSEHAKEASRQATEAYGAYITSVNELATHARAKSQERGRRSCRPAARPRWATTRS